MKVVVDTNVFISGVFFGGKPQRVLEKIVDADPPSYIYVYRPIAQTLARAATFRPCSYMPINKPYKLHVQFIQTSD